MDWVTAIWSANGAACLTLALIFLVVWIRKRDHWAHFMFACNAASVVVIAALELAMMHAQTPEEFETFVRWSHPAVFVMVASLIGFVRLYLNAGRAWLGWAVIGGRAVALVLNFAADSSLNYERINGIRHIHFLGSYPVTVAEGVANPWMLLAQLTSTLTLIFLLDAMVTVWKRRERQRAILLCGSMALFTLLAAGHTAIVHWGKLEAPLMISMANFGIVVAMGYELSTDVLLAVSLPQQLRAQQLALEESERRFELAADAALIGVFTWDLESGDTWVSEPGRVVFGFSVPERMDFDRFLQFVHPDDREMFRHAITNSTNGSGDYQCEFRMTGAVGKPRWIACRGRVEFGRDGKPSRTCGACIDVTERKQMELSLRESEMRFREMADTAPVMIWMAGPDGLCTFFNKRWLDFTGRTMDEEVDHGWGNGLHPADSDRCLDGYHNAFRRRQEFTMEYRLRDASHTYRWVLGHGVPRVAADGTFLGYIGSAIDITERKLAEERFSQVVEAAPSAMIVVSPAGEMTLMNAQAETVFGYRRGELIGQSIETLVPYVWLNGHAGCPKDFARTIKAHTVRNGRDLFGRRKDGSQVPVEVGLSPISTSQGTFVLVSVIDISARRLAEAEAQQQRSELAHLSRVAMLGELSGALAHELNQPLTAILTNAEAAQQILKSEPVDLEELREILEDIVKDDNRAGEVIRRLRMLLKKGELQRQKLDVDETILDVLGLVNSDLLNHGVTARTELQENLPPINGDRVQLQQVFLNLIVNACDAMAQTDATARHLTIRTSTSGAAGIEVCVSDNGRGIPQDQLEQVFAPFFTTKAHGLGLGLSVCRTIIAAHGGRLWATHNPAGTGACFHVLLPCTPHERTV